MLNIFFFFFFFLGLTEGQTILQNGCFRSTLRQPGNLIIIEITFYVHVDVDVDVLIIDLKVNNIASLHGKFLFIYI